MIIDCCSAGSSVAVPESSPNTRNTVFVLAACAPDAVTLMDGINSYTARLIEVLHSEDSMKQGRSVWYIHTAISSLLHKSHPIFSKKKLEPCVPYVLREGPRVLRIERQAVLKHCQPDATSTNIPNSIQGDQFRGDHYTDAGTASPVELTHFPASPASKASAPPAAERPSSPRPEAENFTPSYGSIFYPPVLPSMDNQEEERFLRVVYHDAMFLRFHTVTRSLVGTSEWILHDPTVRQWLDTDHDPLIWIYGKAGSGKSTLTKMVAQRLESLGARTFVHMFWGSGSTIQRSMSGCYRSLLFQVLDLWHNFIPQVRNFHEVGSHDLVCRQWKASLEEVLAALYAGSADYPQLYIFIDALDECSDDHYELVQFLLGLRVKVWVTSRPYYVFERGFRNQPKLRIDEHNQSDIEAYVLSQIAGKRLNEDVCRSLTTAIIKNSKGMFIYAVLATRRVLKAISRGERLTQLQDDLPLPKDLGQMYTNILLSLSTEQQADAARTFALISASHSKVLGVTGIDYEPVLTTWSLCFALGTYRQSSLPLDDQELTALITSFGGMNDIDLEERNMLTIFTGGLIEVSRDDHGPNGSGGLISYMHNSVRQFVEESEVVELIRRDLGTNFNAHLILLGSAIIELKVLIKEISTQDIYSIPLWSLIEKAMTYASYVASEHSELLVRYLDELDRVMALEMGRLSNMSSISHWASLLPLSHPSHGQWRDDLLSIATEYAIVPYVSSKLSEHRALVHRGKGRPLLDYAILPSSSSLQDYGERRIEVVKVLLSFGATFDDTFEGQSIRDRVRHACRFAQIGTRAANSMSDRTRFLLTIEDMITSNLV